MNIPCIGGSPRGFSSFRPVYKILHLSHFGTPPTVAITEPPMQGIWKGKKMDKQEMIRRMSQHVKASLSEDGESVKGAPQFITRMQLAEYMGYRDPHSVDKFLSGLERIAKLYFIPDVVERLKKGSETRC